MATKLSICVTGVDNVIGYYMTENLVAPDNKLQVNTVTGLALVLTLWPCGS